MESKAFVPQSGSVSPSSSSVPVRASPSYDSDIETDSNSNANGLNFDTIKDNNNNTSSISSISSGSSSSSSSVSEEEEEEEDGEDGGFVSGEEEFEPALERPFVAENVENSIVDDDFDENYVEAADVRSLEFSSTGMPIAKVSSDDDDDEGEEDEVLDSPKVRVFEAEEIGELGGSFSGVGLGSGSVVSGVNENAGARTVVGSDVVEASLGQQVNDSEAIINKMVAESEVAEKGVIGGINEAAAEKLVVEDGVDEDVKSTDVEVEIESETGTKADNAEAVNLTPEGDSIVEKIHVLSEGQAVVVGDFIENNDVVPEEAAVPVGVIKTENEFDKIANDVEVPAELKSTDVEVEIESETGTKADNAEAVNLTPEGDSIVEKIHALSEGQAVVVGDFIETNDVVPEEVAVPIGVIKTENEFDLIANDDEVPAELKDETEVTETVLPGSLAKDQHADVKVDAFNGEEELKTVFESAADADADAEAEQNEPMVKLVADGEEILSSSRDIGSNVEEVRGVDAIAQSAETEPEIFLEAEDEISQLPDQGGEYDSDSDTEGMIFGSSESARKFMEKLEHGSGVESSHEHSQRIDGQIVTDSDEEVDTDEEGEGKELFDSAALAALLKAATSAGSDGGNITITSQDGSRLFSVERPAGLGSSLRSVKPAPRQNGSNLFTPSQFNSMGGDSETSLSEEEKKKLEMIQQLRVKFLRIVQRLGHSFEDSVAAQVLYRLALIAGRPTSPLFSLEVAKETATALESCENADLDFSLNILVLGKAGVGKSATINSIFGEEKTSIDAFELSTTSVKEITGLVDGVKVRVFDTPGLKSSFMEQSANQKILSQIKKVTKKCPPDIVLYVDRLDSQTRDLNDLPLLRTITASLGPSIWRSAIVTLTHGASAPPDGPSGQPFSYEVFVAQRSHVVQQSIGQAVGDLRLMNPSLMNPVSLVENHRSCRKNRDGQKVLPNGQTWRPQLLLLCYSMKILSEASSLSKPQDSFDHRKLFGFRTRSPPLPYLLSWLLQSRTHPKLPSDQGADIGDSDIDLDDLSDSDVEDGEDEYDQLPPFKPLKKSQLDKLNKEQRKAYLEEYDYRVKLLQKKQWKEELKRMRESKKRGKAGGVEYGNNGEDMEQEDGGPAAVPVALPDMALPPSFDSDNPAYRYRFLEPTSQLLMRPVLDTHGWDHDCGYDGVNLEQSLAIASRFPAAVAVQITKDKKEFNIHLDSSVAAKHGENNSSMAGFDIQNVGKQLAYILRGETKFKAVKRNTTSAGFSVTFLGENIATGFKLEDQLTLGKRLVLVGSTGTVRSQSDAAYGANLEVRLRESDFPIGQDQSTLGLSLVKWRGDLALGANLQSQFSVGRSSKMAVRVGLNNKLSGQITVRTTSSDQLQIALMGVLPIAMTIYKSLWPGVGENNSIY